MDQADTLTSLIYLNIAKTETMRRHVSPHAMPWEVFLGKKKLNLTIINSPDLTTFNCQFTENTEERET